MKHYIRVEAVNIYNAIADTNNISIIRGGSLLLKQAIEDIKKTFENELEAISTGASIGVFYIKRTAEFDKEQIIKFLNTKGEYRYFTFAVVDCQSDNYQKAKDILIAKVRYLQLQQLSMSADYNEVSKKAVPCEVDGIRPAIKYIPIQTEEKMMNEFAALKFKHGKEQRNDLYNFELSNLFETVTFEFTDNLEDLADDEDNGKKQGNLYKKIAVVYFDGNGFSKIQNKLATTDNEQQEFDREIKSKRRQFLAKLLMNAKGEDWFFKDKQLRLETLLWGGDEMLFVVPAWKGFELLNLFYAESKNWQITINDKTEALTHAGGIVFCPHNTPIYKIRELAQQLADGVKNHPDKKGRTGNYFNYLTLESIDYPAESLDIFFAHKYQKLAKHRGYLNPKNLFEQSISSAELELIPKSQAYTMAQLACQLDIDAFNKQRERLFAISENRDELEKLIKKMTGIFCSQADIETKTEYEAMMWVHLVKLWDYLLPFITTKNSQ